MVGSPQSEPDSSPELRYWDLVRADRERADALIARPAAKGSLPFLLRIDFVRKHLCTDFGDSLDRFGCWPLELAVVRLQPLAAVLVANRGR